MLRANAITKRFGRTLALDGVDFEARPGEIHALLGENGAGKTTLMNVLAGRFAPDAGEACLDGAPLQAGSPRAALDAGIAAVHQSPMLFERMTWEENLALGGFDQAARAARSRGGRRAGARARRETRLRAAARRARTVENRSVAERVRLEVLRALSFNPRVLILDEPTSVLAPSELNAFLDLLRHLRGEGRIVVLITHKLAEAIAVADRITVLRRGRVVATHRLPPRPARTNWPPDDRRAGDSARTPAPRGERLASPCCEIENLALDDRTGAGSSTAFRCASARGEIVGNRRRRRQRPDRAGRRFWPARAIRASGNITTLGRPARWR